MRIVLFADNVVGLEVVRYLVANNEHIVGIFLHPQECQHLADDIIDASRLPAESIFTVGKNWSDNKLKALKELSPDIILVVFWNYILPKYVFEIPSRGCVNFHLSYLPYNRGKKPNVWPIIDGTPAGVSLHYIDEGIDSGTIIARKQVEVEPVDTAKSLYEKLIHEFPLLFGSTWPLLKSGELDIPTINESGTFHLDKDFKTLEEIDLSNMIYPLDLINQLRAKCFSPHPSAFFVQDGRKVYVTINLQYDDYNSSET